MPKLHFGSKGGIYYIKNGKKVYVDKTSSFGKKVVAVAKSLPRKEGKIKMNSQYYGIYNKSTNRVTVYDKKILSKNNKSDPQQEFVYKSMVGHRPVSKKDNSFTFKGKKYYI